MSQSPLNRMYDEFADLWPLFSQREDYAKEAGYWRDVLRKELGPGRHPILELGVGGGHNLSYLTNDFDADAVDLSEKMLEQCRKLNPNVTLYPGDMRTIRLGKKYKAVLIHDAISCMQTEDDLRQAFATAAAHLEPGGVFITAPDYYRETFTSPQVSHATHSDENTELTLIDYQYVPNPDNTILESLMFYIIRTQTGLRIEQDRHIQGLFPLETWLTLMHETGFSVKKYPYPVHEDGCEAYLLTGKLDANTQPAQTENDIRDI